MSWLKELLGTEKAIIAMCHFQAMPGDPNYDQSKGVKYVVECAAKDLDGLQKGGVDAIMFSNEFSLPYLTKVRSETVATMARIITELKPMIKVPYGVNCLWDPFASIDLAVATDALFIREVMSGVYAGDFGLWNTSSGELVRHQHSIGAQHVKKIFNIVPEGAMYLAPRDLKEIARSTNFNCLPDAIAVSGITAGVDTDPVVLREVKSVLPDTVVLANTGCRIDTVEQQLSIADGAVVGTTFKKDGVFKNGVDEARVKTFMDKVISFRSQFL